MTVDMDYFRTKRSLFQQAMGNSRLSVEQVSAGLKGLLVAYLALTRNPSVSDVDKSSAECLMRSAAIEHDRRLAYRIRKEAFGV